VVDLAELLEPEPEPTLVETLCAILASIWRLEGPRQQEDPPRAA
jgi:hypothetical protein